jgi:hypothetical protein
LRKIVARFEWVGWPKGLIMMRSGNWRSRAAAVIAMLILLASPARAGCNPSDIFNAAKQTASGLSSCASACSTGVGCAVSLWLTGVLSEIAAAGGQDLVNSFCDQAQGSASQISSKLGSVAGSSIAKGVLGEVASKLESVGSAADVASCACKTEQGVGSLGSDIGDCMGDALCWAQEKLGMGACDCTVPPPTYANCAALDIKACAKYGGDWRHAECVASGNIGSLSPDCQNDQYMAK